MSVFEIHLYMVENNSQWLLINIGKEKYLILQWSPNEKISIYSIAWTVEKLDVFSHHDTKTYILLTIVGLLFPLFLCASVFFLWDFKDVFEPTIEADRLVTLLWSNACFAKQAVCFFSWSLKNSPTTLSVTSSSANSALLCRSEFLYSCCRLFQTNNAFGYSFSYIRQARILFLTRMTPSKVKHLWC